MCHGRETTRWSSVVGRFRREYLKLPFDHFHGKKWRRLTTKQVLAAVEKLDDAAKAKLRLTGTTTARILGPPDAACKIPRGLDNPLRGHFTAGPRGRAARDEYPMWPGGSRQGVFHFACLRRLRVDFPTRHAERRNPSRCVVLDSSGRPHHRVFARTKICGRLVGDIAWDDTEMGRLPYLKIRNSKTSSSSRDVPLHELVLQVRIAGAAVPRQVG